MSVFLPKFLQRKTKNETVIKCVGTRDNIIMPTEEDSIIVQPSHSDLEEDYESINFIQNSNNSSFISRPRYNIFPQCCSKHLIDSSYKNFKYPSHSEMMYKRLELYFKKYPGQTYKKNGSEIKFIKETHLEKEETKKVKNTLNKESLIPIKCSSPDNSMKNNLLHYKVHCNIINSKLDQKLEKHKTFTSRQQHTEYHELDMYNNANASRQPSIATTRSSQDIYYTANSNNISSKNTSSEDCYVSNKSFENLKSKGTTCSYTSSKSYCEEIAKLNNELSPNSQFQDLLDTTKDSLNWNTSMGYDNVSTISKSKQNQSLCNFKIIDSDNITSFTNENETNFNISNDQFTIVSVLSDKDQNLSFPTTEVTQVSPIKMNVRYDILHYKKLLNAKFEKKLTSSNMSSEYKSRVDLPSWNISRDFKSLSQFVSKLPRRKYKKTLSLLTDINTFNRFTYLSG